MLVGNTEEYIDLSSASTCFEEGNKQPSCQIPVGYLMVNKGKERKYILSLLKPGQVRFISQPSSCEGENKVSNLNSF